MRLAMHIQGGALSLCDSSFSGEGPAVTHQFTKIIVFGIYPVTIKVKDAYRHQSSLLFPSISFHFFFSLLSTHETGAHGEGVAKYI